MIPAIDWNTKNPHKDTAALSWAFIEGRARRYGFTLIELLIVLGIVALLLAILIPVFLNVRQRGQLATCTSNLHQLALAADLYSQDNDGNLPAGSSDGSPAWDVVTQTYVKDKSVYDCPSGAVLYSYRPDQLSGLLGHRVSLPRVPNLVLLVCTNHVDSPVLPKTGNWVFVREDGSASHVPPGQAALWWYVQGKWYAPGSAHSDDSSGNAGGFYVFPGEPWPPQLQ